MKYEQIKSLLTSIEDPVMKLEFVMDFGKQIGVIPHGAQCTEISGCASRVQICEKGGTFYGLADSALVSGIVAIILAMANDKVADKRGEFVGLNLSLGAGRLSGVNSILNYFE